MVDLATKGGLLPEHITSFQDTAAQTLKEFFSQLKGAEFGRAAQSAINFLGKPLMAYYVPRMKYGSTLVRMERQMEKLNQSYHEQYGEKWSPEVEANYQKDLLNIAYNERQYAENIFGEIQYDNLHWSKAMSKGLKALIGYPGWNVGTFRWMTGMGRGLYQGVKSGVQGKAPELDYQSRRSMQFGMGLLVANALANSILHMAINGEPPEDWQDVMIGAKTGKIMSNGSPERVGIASYMKDLMGMSKHPIKTAINKVMFANMLSEIYHNADYSGTEIMRSKGTLAQQAGDIASYAGKQVLPYGFSGMMGTGRSPVISAGGFFGLKGIGREYTNTTAQQHIDDILRAKAPTQRTDETAQKGKLMSELRQLGWEGRRGEMEQRMQAARQAGLITVEQMRKMRKDTMQDQRLVQFQKLSSLEDALTVFAEGNPDEQTLWRGWLARKIFNAKPETKRKLRGEIDQFYGRQ
jgi:hypothetical protein